MTDSRTSTVAARFNGPSRPRIRISHSTGICKSLSLNARHPNFTIISVVKRSILRIETSTWYRLSLFHLKNTEISTVFVSFMTTCTIYPMRIAEEREMTTERGEGAKEKGVDASISIDLKRFSGFTPISYRQSFGKVLILHQDRKVLRLQ
jgi:hypothetical protein